MRHQRLDPLEPGLADADQDAAEVNGMASSPAVRIVARRTAWDFVGRAEMRHRHAPTGARPPSPA